ncbi:hypothetical protein DAEQUDRAFT_807380 [Daedalea quercina L-15889]|uniref:Pentacotripeptide-repeat region of PRORP domain-containing protein n=1 Tax=Daedalea quercina L-15889 TaxID=1314783 RepID=A0A165UMH3_9APHY|nr:hypothetical protein DAEQUDRAFT_807380 [Daedalea quercina L-15889]
MLARRTSHCAASFISLYFLAPRLLCRTNTTSSASSGAARGADNKGSARPLASSPAPALDPAKLIGRLDKQLQKFHGQPYDGLAPHEVQVFNRAIQSLRSTAETADTREVYHIWRTLKDRNMLRFFGPVQHDMISRFVVAVCENRSGSGEWSELETRALPELALFSAAGGVTEGLTRCMLVFIQENNPQAVIDLYERYYALLETKTPLAEAGKEEGQSTVPAVESQDSPTATGPTFSPALTLVRGDVLLAAITAFAMQGSFPGALQVALQTTVRILPTTITPWLRMLSDPKLAKQVDLFVRRLEVAKLLARPTSLARQLSNLTRDRAVSSLQSLYRRIMDGLTGPDRWLTISQQDAGTLTLVPEFLWSLFITALMRSRRTDLAQKLWDDVLKLGVRPPVGMWTALIDGYAELKAADDALNTWHVMLSQGIQPDALSYRALIYALYHVGRVDDAFDRFKEFQRVWAKMVPRPEEATVLIVYNTMLHGLLFHHHEGQARTLFEQMQLEGPSPDIVTYNTFLRWYSRKEQLKSFAEVLQMLEPNGLKGDVYTFSIVLSALMKVRDDAPQIMLNLMQRHGVQPNTATMTSIIDQQMKTQTEAGFHSALDLLNRMERGDIEGAEPNEVTYTAVLTAIHRNTWLLSRSVVNEYRQMVWNQMEARGIKPMRTTYNSLIHACFDNPDPEGVQQALHYYRDMTKRGVFMSNDTWYILLRGLMQRKEWSLANELVEEMREQDFVPPGALADLIRKVRLRIREKIKAGPAGYF